MKIILKNRYYPDVELVVRHVVYNTEKLYFVFEKYKNETGKEPCLMSEFMIPASEFSKEYEKVVFEGWAIPF